MHSFKYDELNGGEWGTSWPHHNLTQSRIRHMLATTVVSGKLKGRKREEGVERGEEYRQEGQREGGSEE